MKSAALVVTLMVTLAGCASANRPVHDHTTSPTTSIPEETMIPNAVYISTIKKGTRRSIADEPLHIIVGNVTADGRTALDVTVQGEGTYGTIYLSDGEDFEIKGIPFHIEAFPESGQVTVYQLAADPIESSTPPSP